ncbi:hypothetical protein BKA62DRAFT_722432 [Auriculariales sp. MPI-PUGE-AT-0066]|nr:hypothetical protein BKA62DRAFT_722432 [Auriculariales sp. MPI-PUGE-AT-0066]
MPTNEVYTPMSPPTTPLLLYPDDSGRSALHLRAMRACIPHHSTAQINVNWHPFHVPLLNLRIQYLVIFLFLIITDTTSAAFTREAAYRLDQVRPNSAGTYCFHPRTLPGRIASCMDQSLSMLLDIHVNNKHGPGLSISYYDTQDLSVLGGADWREWNTTSGPVGVCLSGSIEGIEGSYLTFCRYATSDDDHSSRTAQAVKCSIDRPQQRVVDGCYLPPSSPYDFKLSGRTEAALAIVGLAIAIFTFMCAGFKIIWRYVVRARGGGGGGARYD